MKLKVRYHDAAELVADGEQQFSRGGFFVRVVLEAEPELFTSVELAVELGARRVVVEGQVVQVAPGVGVAVGFTPSEALEQLIAVAKDTPAGGDPAEHGVDEDTGDTPAEAHLRYRNANKAERIKMARYGGRDERMLIFRGGDRSLHRWVLNNPGLGLDEVTFIAKQTHVSADLLKAIADRREWASRPEIALALVRNPKTPMPLALKMLNQVSMNDLRQIAKSSSLRMPLLQAARKKVVNR